MSFTNKAVKAALFAAAITATSVFLAGPAWAHVKVTADHSWRGGVAILTFSVPNESQKGSPTTQLNVALPNVTSAHTEVMPGWTAQLDHDIPAGVFHSVTWTAAPNAGIPADQFALFRIEVTLPNSDTASFPATQSYADGQVVRWDQPPLPGGAEPEHPAPMLKLTAATPESDEHPTTLASPTVGQASPAPAAPDNTARLLAGAAIVVGSLGVALALVTRRRR